MYSFKSILAFTCILLFSTSIAAYTPDSEVMYPNICAFQIKHLSLREAIVLALRNNPQIRSAELQRIVDRFTLEVARNEFLPQYSFDTSATYSNGTKPFYSTNPKTSLLTPWGATIGVGVEDQVNAGRQTAATLQIVQPLLRGFGPSVTQANYRNTLDQECINRLDFKDTLINTITSVIQSYYKLVQDFNAIKVDQLSLKDAVKMLHVTELRIKAGKVAPTEVVQQQAQIANQKLAVTKDRNQLSQDYRELLVRLGLDPRSRLSIDKCIQTGRICLPSPQQAIQIALENNIEFRKSLTRLHQLERALLLAQNEQSWKLDLIGRASQDLYHEKNFANVPINKVDTIGNDTISSDRTLILNLNIPIHDLTRKQIVVRARIALQQFRIALCTQQQQLIASVLNTLQNLQTQNLQLQLASKAVDYSRQSLEIAQKKFQYGRTTMFEITTLQKNLTLQQLAFITQQISYLNTQAEFDKLLGIALDKWCITVNY